MFSLKLKLALLAILPVFISFGTFYYLSNIQFSKPLESSLAGDLKAKVRLVANDIDRFVSQRVTDVKILSRASQLLSSDLASVTRYLKNVAGDSEWISQVGLLDHSGKILSHSGERGEGNRPIWSNDPAVREFFEQGKRARSQNVFVLEPEEPANDTGAGIILLTAVATDLRKSPSRYLLVEVSLQELQRIILEFQHLMKGKKHIYVVRNDGSIVLSDLEVPHSARMFPDIDKHPEMLGFFSKPRAEGYFNYLDRDENLVAASYVDLGEFGSNLALDWSLIATADAAVIMAPVNHLKKLLTWAGVLLCLLMAGAAAIVFRRIAAPLEQMTTAAERIKQGEYAYRISQIKGSKEITTLAEVFNSMVSEIAAHTRALADSNSRLSTFDTIIAASPTPIYLNDAEGRYLLVNRAFLELHNLREEEVVGQTSQELFPPEIAQRYFSQVQTVLSTGRRVEQMTQVLDGQGGLHDVLVTKFPVLDTSGEIRAIGGIDIDLTEQKSLEEKLAHAQKMETVGTLAGGIAHDFNNLLAAILGHIYLVERKLPKPHAAEKNIEQIQIASTRATELVRQILAYSRREKATLRPVNLRNSISEALELLSSTLPSSIAIRQRSGGAAETLVVDADETQLQQILINLCTNAAHAMRGKGTLTIDLQQVEKPSGHSFKGTGQRLGPYAQLSVGDDGIGMSRETIGKIFDPFFTTKASGEGTGMGLSVVHGLVEGHNGFISVESQPNRGSTFRVCFPLSREADQEKVKASDADLQPGNERILLVDDEQGLASACSEWLEMQGYRVTRLSDSVAALSAFQSASDGYDLVITDQTMPGMLGTELSAKLRKIRPDIPIILCSGFCTEDLKQELGTLGIQALCTKPTDLKTFAEVVRQSLNSQPGNGPSSAGVYGLSA